MLFKSIILLVGFVGTIAVAVATFLGSILCEAIVLPSKTETKKKQLFQLSHNVTRTLNLTFMHTEV